MPYIASSDVIVHLQLHALNFIFQLTLSLLLYTNRISHGRVYRFASHGKVAASSQRIQSPAHAPRTHAVHAAVQPPPPPSGSRTRHHEPGRSVAPRSSAARRTATQKPRIIHGSVGQVRVHYYLTL